MGLVEALGFVALVVLGLGSLVYAVSALIISVAIDDQEALGHALVSAVSGAGYLYGAVLLSPVSIVWR